METDSASGSPCLATTSTGAESTGAFGSGSTHCAGSNPTYLQMLNRPASASSKSPTDQRLARFAQQLPGIVFVQRFDLAAAVRNPSA